MKSSLAPKILDEDGTDLSKTGINSVNYGLSKIFGVSGPKQSLNLDYNVKGSLADQYSQSGKHLEDDIHIKGITHAPGYGAVAVVNIGGNKKNYMMTLPTEAATEFAMNMNPKNEKEKTIQSNILNEAKSNALNDIVPAINYQIPLVKQGVAAYPVEHTITANNKNTTFQIIPSIDKNGSLTDITVRYKDADDTYKDYADNKYPNVQSWLNEVYKPQ